MNNLKVYLCNRSLDCPGNEPSAAKQCEKLFKWSRRLIVKKICVGLKLALTIMSISVPHDWEDIFASTIIIAATTNHIQGTKISLAPSGRHDLTDRQRGWCDLICWHLKSYVSFNLSVHVKRKQQIHHSVWKLMTSPHSKWMRGESTACLKRC